MFQTNQPTNQNHIAHLCEAASIDDAVEELTPWAKLHDQVDVPAMGHQGLNTWEITG